MAEQGERASAAGSAATDGRLPGSGAADEDDEPHPTWWPRTYGMRFTHHFSDTWLVDDASFAPSSAVGKGTPPRSQPPDLAALSMRPVDELADNPRELKLIIGNLQFLNGLQHGVIDSMRHHRGTDGDDPLDMTDPGPVA